LPADVLSVRFVSAFYGTMPYPREYLLITV